MTHRPIIARVVAAAAPGLLLAGCAGLVGGGKAPPFLMSLTPEARVQPGATAQSTASGSIGVMTPSVPKELSAMRVPVMSPGNQISYMVGGRWVDAPARLFRNLLNETIAAKTGRLVLSEEQYLASPGTRLSGELVTFGVDATSREAVVVYDGVMTNGSGDTIAKKRFEAREPVAQIVPVEVGPALNRAANKVAVAVAGWN